jgi:hypothetical protein
MAYVRDAPVVLQVEIADHLSERALEAALGPIAARLRADARPCRLVIDCGRMTGYDGEARSRFVAWNQAHRGRLERVAIVTANRLYQMVVSAMALASRQEMRAFDDLAAARAWAAGQGRAGMR